MKSIFSAGRATLCAACLFLSTPVAAQDVIGEIRAMLDGKEQVWQTLESTSGDISFNTAVTSYGPVQDITVQGYKEGGSYMRDVFVISLAVMADGSVIDATVMHVPDSMSQSWTNPEGESVVTLDTFDGTSASGTLSGRLCYKDGFTAEPDTDKCIPVEGRFETRLPKEG